MRTWKLLLALPIIFCLCFAGSIQQYQAQIIKMKKAAAPGCTTASDEMLDASTHGATQESADTSVYRCQRHSLTATDDITEYQFSFCDDNSDTGQFRFSLWTDNADEPGSEIEGTDITILASSVPDCGSPAAVTVTLAATKVDVGVTTCWLCYKKENSADGKYDFDDYQSGERRCDSENGVDWSCSVNSSFDTEVWGCP